MVQMTIDGFDILAFIALAVLLTAAMVIYTDWGKRFALISKVVILIHKWLYFLPLPPKT